MKLVNKKFATITAIVRRQLTDLFFQEANIDKYFSGSFTDLPLEEILHSSCELFSESIAKFINPVIEQALWVNFLERIVKNYVQCFFNGSSKLKQKGHEGVVDLLQKHSEIFKEMF